MDFKEVPVFNALTIREEGQRGGQLRPKQIGFGGFYDLEVFFGRCVP